MKRGETEKKPRGVVTGIERDGGSWWCCRRAGKNGSGGMQRCNGVWWMKQRGVLREERGGTVKEGEE